MKKPIYLLFFCLAAMLAACSVEHEDYLANYPDKDGEITSLEYRKYMEPFVGPWSFVGYDIVTHTVVSAADGTVLNNIHGKDSREVSATWTFNGDGWGTIVFDKNTSSKTGNASSGAGDGFPYHTLHPLLIIDKEFQWVVSNDSIMKIQFYGDTASDIYDARFFWPIAQADNELSQNYKTDVLTLAIDYTTYSDFNAVCDIYSGYDANSTYDGTGCTYTIDVTASYHLVRK